MTAFLLALLLALQQRPIVTASLDREEVRVGDRVLLRITVQTTGGPPAASVPIPELPPQLQIVSTREVSHTSLSLPGGRSSTMSREVLIVANAPGDYLIRPVRVTVDGVSAYTPLLALKVTGTAPVNPTPGARLIARMEPETVYVGQQATLVGELLMSVDLQMRLTRPPSYEAPAPSDFWMQDLESDAHAEPRIIDDERYVGQRFYRAYFPLTPGKYAFAPAKVTYEARQGFLFAPQVFELRSASPKVVVLAHPDAGRPPNFDGAVGKFEIDARIEPSVAAAGDALYLHVEITGSGNVKALPVPRLPAIPGAEVLDPSETTDVTTAAQTVSGAKRFSWVVVPEREGVLTVPAIEYVVFDPDTRRYITRVTAPLTVDVQPAGTAAPQRNAVLRTEPMQERFAFVNSRTFIAFQVVPIAFLVAALAWRRRKQSLPRSVRRAWRARLAALQVDPMPFAGAEQLLRDALYTVSPMPQFRSGSVTEVGRAAAAVLSGALAERIKALLERLEGARYASAPVSADERASVLDELRAILDGIWRAADTLAAQSSRAAVLPIVLLLALPQAQPSDLLRAGVSEFAAGRQNAAADNFRSYVAAYPDDASGWYNLGVVHRAQRHPALAAWAFLEAAALDPRASDIDAQIQRSGLRSLGQRVRPVMHMTRSETFMVASVFWWLGALAVTLAILRRRKSYVLAAMLLLTLASGVLLSWAIERALPRPAIVLDAGAPLLAASSRHADEIRQLLPLTGVSVLEARDGWLRVRTLEGDRGWVEESRLGTF